MINIKKSNLLLSFVSILFISIVFLLFTTIHKYSQLTFMHIYNICHQAITSWLTTAIHFLGFSVSSGILLLGLLFLARLLFSFIKTQNKLTVFIRERLKSEPPNFKFIRNKVGLSFSRVILFHSEKEIVFTGGILNARIFISKNLIDTLSDKELEAVLIHEKYHLDNKHSLFLFIVDIIVSTLLFVPLFNTLFSYLKVQFEKEADNAVIETQKTVRYLQSALMTVMGESIPAYYPGFYSRRTHKISLYPIFTSALSISILVILMFIPYETQATFTEVAGSCNQNQCNINCNPKAEITSLSSQNKLFSSRDN